MIRPVMIFLVMGIVTVLMLVILVVALVSNRQAEEVEATSDIPALDLGPPDGMQVWNHRATGRHDTTYSRGYATLLDDAGVAAFYEDALTSLGYARVDDPKPSDGQGPRVLGEYVLDGVRYRVSVADTPGVVSGTRVTDEWSLVVYTRIDVSKGR